MATTSNEQPRRNRRSPRRRIVGPIRAGRGLGRATAELLRSVGRIRVPAFQQTRASGKDGPGPGRLRTLCNRSVAAIRQSITTTRGLPARAARQITRRAGRGRDPAGAIRPTAATEQAQVGAKPKARATTRRTRQRRATSQQGKPAQARRMQDLEQRTVQELRAQARGAGIERSSSMTKKQLIKALRDHR